MADWNNKDFVMEIVNNNGTSLKYASENLKNDIEVLYYSIKNYREGKTTSYHDIIFCNDLIPIKHMQKYKSLEKIENIFYIYIQKEKLNFIDKFCGDFDLSFKFM
jgi:hypothetical protein